MLRMSNLDLRPKMLLFHLVTGMIPLLMIGVFGSRVATHSLMAQSFSQLTTVQSIRKAQVESEFAEHFHNITVLGQSHRVRSLLADLSVSMAETRALATFRTDTAYYSRLVQGYRDAFRKILEGYGYHDMMLIAPATGHVVFSVQQEADLGTSLKHGPYRDSGLARAWERVMATGDTVLVDFESFAPSNGQQSAFLGEPVRDEDGTLVGVLVLQLSPAFITKITDSRMGMGRSGNPTS